MEPINEMIERFLVALGLALNQLSEEETGMVSLLLLLLVVAAAVSHGLRVYFAY